MSNEQWQGFGTRCVHVGQEPDPATGAAAPPIHQTTSYVFDSAEDAAARYALEGDGNIYGRFDNPTVQRLERRLASLEGGVSAVATSAGMAAFDALTSLLVQPGQNVVSAASIYGGTHAYLTYTAGSRGVESRFVDTLDYEAYEEAIDEDTAFLHCETIGNPALVTPDLERLGEIADDHGIPFVVDNTFATPYLCNPLDHGADIIWESTTKWITGSGTTLGGIIVDSGEFDWQAHGDKFPELGKENPAFRGLNFAERFGENALSVALKHRSLRSMGDGQSPFDAWATLQGSETLELRMERHCENAMTVAEYLEDHSDVAWVSYPGLPDHETHDTAGEYLDGGYGGMVAFGLEDGYEGGKRVCEDTEVAKFLANVGDARTLVIHPASTTHAQLSPEEQQASGVTRDLIRLSVGIEEADDIIADLDQAI